MSSDARPGSMRTFACAMAVATIGLFAFAQSAQGYVYWTNPNGNSIGRANLDGTGVNSSFIAGATSPQDVEVDAEYIYWANGNGDIGRANLDGTGANPSFIVDPTADATGGLAVGSGHIYWVSSRWAEGSTNPYATTGRIGRANLDGTAVDPNFITGTGSPAGGLAADGSHLYWGAYDPNRPLLVLNSGPLPTTIARANADGTGVEQNFVTAEPNPFGIAADAQSLWWINEAPAGDGQTPTQASRLVDSVYRVPLAGGEKTQVIAPEKLGGCGGLAIGTTHLYWAHGDSIGRARLDGSRATTYLIETTGSSCTGVAADDLGPGPSSEFSLGKAKTDRKHGTAKLTVTVAGPGDLVLAKSDTVKAASAVAEQGGDVKLAVKARGQAKQDLRDRGFAQVTAEVTYTPEDGQPATDSRRVKLKLKR